jgi:hypothetical protein
MRPACWRLLTSCGVHSISSALGTGLKLGSAIKHLTIVGVSFGMCVVLGAGVGCPPGLVVYWFSFCNVFSICVKKKKTVNKQSKGTSVLKQTQKQGAKFEKVG